MNEIIETINSIYTLLNTNEAISKNSLHGKIILLNNLLTNYFDNIKLDTSKYDDMLIHNNDVEIKRLDEKLKKMSSDKTIVLNEAVSLGEDKIRQFLEKYNIGFLKELYLDNYGNFIVEIPCLLSKHNSFHDKEYSKNIKFNKQMNYLKNIGLDIGESKISGNKSPAIIATQKSIDCINNLITKIGGLSVKLCTTLYKGQTTIRSINFRIKPEKLFEYDEVSTFDITCNTSNILNQDELFFIKYELQELKNTCLDYTDENLIQVRSCCKNIILHSFANICKTANIETEISKEVETHYRESKEKIKIINDKRELIKKSIDASTIKKITENIMSIMEKFASEKICFYTNELKITNTNCYVSLLFNKCGEPFYIYNDEIEQIDENKLKELFDCSNGCFEDETLIIKNTNDNILKLNAIINKNFNGAKIETIQTQRDKFGEYYIDKLTVSFPNLNVFA